jgi:TolA-binding protein
MLTDSGKLALEAHLADCESCHLDQQIFAGLDEDSVVEIRDGARLERLSATARAWALGRRHGAIDGKKRVWRARGWAAAAAILLLAGAAGAATWWMGRQPGRSPHTVPSRPGPRVVAAAPAAPPVVAAPPAAAVEPSEQPRAVEPAPPRPARAAAQVTAASLLRQAGDARREGDAERALTLYRRLQSDFAGSPEAMLSQVPLGGLLFERGREREALAQFDRYLDSVPRGVLVPEALYGRARALAALGDRPEEQRAWQRLLRDFPTSAYAPLAGRRIAPSR